MRYTEPEIIGIIDPFEAFVLGDEGSGTVEQVSQIGLTSQPGMPVILPDGTEGMYDEFGEIIEG